MRQVITSSRSPKGRGNLYLRDCFVAPLGILAMTLCFVTGCGYTTGSVISSRFQTVYVAPFKNKIDYGSEKEKNVYLPLMEVKVTNAVVDRFLFDGNLDIATEDRADIVLKGELLRYERSPLRYDDNDEVQEYRIAITVNISLWEPGKSEPVWSEPYFMGDTTYYTSGSLVITEDAAVEKAITDLARRIVERTIEDW